MAQYDSILVIGLGRFGTAVLQTLWAADVETVVLDRDRDTIDALKDQTNAAFVGDSTEDAVLRGIGVAQVDAVVVTFGSHFESAVLTVATLAELKAKYIVARAETSRQSTILRAVGAHRVVEVERDMGERFAQELTTPVTQELLDFAEAYRVLPWEASGNLVGKRLAEARLRERYGILVLGYRRRDEHLEEGQKPRLHIPHPDYELTAGDTLLIVGEADEVTRFVDEVGDG